MLAVSILGNNSAVPAFDRHPTSQVITIGGNLFLVDCGEGTQIQMIKYRIRRSKISHIFISHLHGDHYFGLVGLITSFGLLNHLQDLHIYAPHPLQQIIEWQLKVASTTLPYKLFFHTISKEEVLVDEEKFCIECFPTNHRIECYGFLFHEKKSKRKLDPGKAKEFGVPVVFYDRLKNGEDYARDDGAL